MKRKKLPKLKHKGLVIYCSNSKCRKYFSWTHKTEKQENGSIVKTEPFCGITKKKLSSCKNFSNHKYMSRLHIPGSNDNKKAKILTAESYPEAAIQAIEFENEFKSHLQPSDNNQKINKRHCKLP